MTLAGERILEQLPAVNDPAEADDDRDLLRLAIRGAGRRARVDGASFILDAPAEVVPVWGEDDNVLWASGEPALINGPTGVGKTTLAQQVVLGRLGLRCEVLGYPVAPDDRRVLYLACDRPAQAARSMARMVGEEDREVLAERLVVWRGPLPGDIVKKPALLATLADDTGAGTVVVDSLKDVAPRLSEDETGQRVNEAFQLLVAEGVQALGLHHQRKAQAGGGKPKALADVYGSTWITAGMGSVMVLWGEAGDAIVELSHLKQPVETVGPLMVVHDHRAGSTTVQAGVDLYELVRVSNGLTPTKAAEALFSTLKPAPNEVEKARRRLDALVRKGLVHRVDHGPAQAGGPKRVLYYLTSLLDEAS
ncbi:MAG: AAA family ATPase [Actinomycetota bacterium]|nr:AAA family ATPase [Actinomycetota bacterium]